MFENSKGIQEGYKVDEEIVREEVKGVTDHLGSQKNLLEESQTVLDQLKSLLEMTPTEIKKLIDEEGSKHDKMIVKLQMEQQGLLEEKERIEQERYNRLKEKESLGKLLADLIKEDKYTEADILQQKLSAVSNNITNITKSLSQVLIKLNFNEQSKTECYKNKEKLLESFNEVLNSWTVI